jgi:hypothetical protein
LPKPWTIRLEQRFFADFSPEDALTLVNSPIVRDAQLALSRKCKELLHTYLVGLQYR